MTTAVAARDNRARFSEEERNNVRRALLEGLAEQQHLLDEYTGVLADLDDDRDDVDRESRLHAAAWRQHAADAIARIDSALARLDAGTYGRCNGCGDAIASARLEALPDTVQCLSCASAGLG